MLLLLMSACSVGAEGPAPANSPAAVLAADAASLAREAAEVDRLAHDLTSQVDESRRAVQEGRSSPEAEIAKIEALSMQVADKNAGLQDALRALEQRVKDEAQPKAPPASAQAAD